MSSNALLTIGASHDEEILRMMDVGEFAELNDFLGEILHPEVSPDFNTSMVPIRTATPAVSHQQYHYQQHHQEQPESCAAVSPVALPPMPLAPQMTPANVLPLAPALHVSTRVSPTHSISGGDSSGDDSSTGPGEDGIPHTVTTGMFQYDETFQDAHTQLQHGACTTDDVVAKKKIRRRERNREHAKKCRSRKKNYLKSLEESVMELKQENDKLRRMVMTKFTKEELSNMVKGPSDLLATALKKSTNKAVTKSAESYLQSLRDECKM